MIIFFNKKTGAIEGTINGRIHNEDHLNMWVGDKKTTDRIICNWIEVNGEYEPEIQQDIFRKLDNEPRTIKDYKVDVKINSLKSL